MILQFGAGNFLRAFADLFVSELQDEGDTAPGPVVVVQSTGRERADALNRAGGRYHVAVQGFRDGAVVDETLPVRSIREALQASTQWDRVLEMARAPDLSMILSNTTEAGFALDENEGAPGAEAPRSFPAKLLAVLAARCEAGEAAPWIVPCELVENNAEILRGLVLEQAERWNVDGDTVAWIRDGCRWAGSLVDRIVPGTPREHPLLGSDPLLVAAEPFAFWAVETGRDDFPLAAHPAVFTAPDISPFALRKVRILNGAHTALVCRALASGPATVRECLEDPGIGAWLEALLFEEIVPVLEGRCPDPSAFARDCLDRFRNPFLEHRLSAIALHHEAKIETRLRPTREEFRERFGREPERLAALFG